MQSTTNLPGGDWMDVAATVTQANGLKQVIVPLSAAMQCFRLAQ